jgi:hypothetical protein
MTIFRNGNHDVALIPFAQAILFIFFGVSLPPPPLSHIDFGTFPSSSTFLLLYCLTQSILMTTTGRKRSTLSSSLMAVGWTRFLLFLFFVILLSCLSFGNDTKKKEKRVAGKFHQSTDLYASINKENNKKQK